MGRTSALGAGTASGILFALLIAAPTSSANAGTVESPVLPTASSMETLAAEQATERATSPSPPPVVTTPTEASELLEEMEALRAELQTQGGNAQDFTGFAGTALSAFVGALAALLGVGRTNAATSKRELAKRSIDLETRLWELDRELVVGTFDAIRETTRSLHDAYELVIAAQISDRPESERQSNAELMLAARSNAERRLSEVVAVERRLKSMAGPEYETTLTEYVTIANSLGLGLMKERVNTIQLHARLNDLNAKQRDVLRVLSDALEDLDERLDAERQKLARISGLGTERAAA